MNDKKTEISILLIENNVGNARLIESLLQDSQGYDIEISWLLIMFGKNTKNPLFINGFRIKWKFDTF